MKNINLYPSTKSINALKFKEQVQYFINQLKTGKYSPEKEFVIVNKKMQILHGDALFDAFKQLNHEVYFMIVEDKHVDFIIQYSNIFSGLMNEKIYISPADVISILKNQSSQIIN